MPSLLFTCEHARPAVPVELEPILAAAFDEAAWSSHRAFDLGALEAAEALATACEAPLLATAVSRLVVDANRHPGHPRVFSPPVARLDPLARGALLEAHHRPHRRAVEARVRALAPVLHVAVHSFTPRLDGRDRPMDIALLYDPGRRPERALAARWKERLGARLPGVRLRRNAPYRGTSDGLPAALRRRLEPERYAGFELELNQRAWADGAWPESWLVALADVWRELAGSDPLG